MTQIINDAQHKYAIGDEVQVKMVGGWKDGTVVAIHQNYAWSGEDKYEIHGRELVTITSARLMREVEP